jgi:very-short-patch-repair endonuclease
VEHQNAPLSEKFRRFSPRLLSRAREMRQESAPAEKLLWHYLRNRQIANLKFRRQAVIGNYIADFYCADRRLVVELDGISHLDRIDHDEERTRWMTTRDLRVVRFGNHEVFENIEGVLLAIASACGADLDLASFNPPLDDVYVVDASLPGRGVNSEIPPTKDKPRH